MPPKARGQPPTKPGTNSGKTGKPSTTAPGRQVDFNNTSTLGIRSTSLALDSSYGLIPLSRKCSHIIILN